MQDSFALANDFVTHFLSDFGEMEESCLLLCLLYLPKEERTSLYVRSTFLATWAHLATQGLLDTLPPVMSMTLALLSYKCSSNSHVLHSRPAPYRSPAGTFILSQGMGGEARVDCKALLCLQEEAQGCPKNTSWATWLSAYVSVVKISRQQYFGTDVNQDSHAQEAHHEVESRKKNSSTLICRPL